MQKGKVLPGVVIAITVLMATGSALADNWFTGMLWGYGVKGSGEVVTEEREIGEFTKIEASGAFDVSVKAGKKQEVLLTFDDNLLEFVKTKVTGGKLKIYSDKHYRSKHTCQVEITVPRLEGVTTCGSGDIAVSNFHSKTFECIIKGSGDITIDDLSSDVFRCDINGSGDITVRNIDSDFLECHIRGSGDLTAKGRAGEVEIRVAGSGDVDTRHLVANEATVIIKGSGDVKVYAEEDFDGAVYGSGDISYYGNPPHTSKHVAGSGTIKRR